MVALRNEVVAIFAVDPGTVSGVAHGVFSTQAQSVWKGLSSGQWDAYEVAGSPTEQAWEIITNYAEWIGFPQTERLGTNHIHLVFEDFTLRLGEGAASRSRLLDPVRVIHACDALCLTRAGMRWAFPEFQQPTLAKGFATNERLRAHGMWTKGSEHTRDAVRHLCRKYATILGNS